MLMKHALKLMTVTLATLVMLAYTPHGYARSNDVPSVVTVSVPGVGLVDIQINRYENLVKTLETKRLWRFMDSPIAERPLSY
jgi:hypothetical protein